MTDLANFAAAVLARCASAPERFRFGRSKVFIAALDPSTHTKRLLVEAHRAGLLTLSRCDLTPAVDDKSLVTESETTYLHACFHLITVPG